MDGNLKEWGAMLMAQNVSFADIIVKLIDIYDKSFVHAQV